MNGDATQSDHSPGSDPLNWDDAVRAATALLTRRYGLPDTQHHPALAHEAQMLAALLCAYGGFPRGDKSRQVATDERRQADSQNTRFAHQAGAPANDPHAGEFVALPGIEQTISDTFLGKCRGEST